MILDECWTKTFKSIKQPFSRLPKEMYPNLKVLLKLFFEKLVQNNHEVQDNRLRDVTHLLI